MSVSDEIKAIQQVVIVAFTVVAGHSTGLSIVRSCACDSGYREMLKAAYIRASTIPLADGLCNNLNLLGRRTPYSSVKQIDWTSCLAFGT